ncbi:MAG: hypothetical protein LBJ63_08685 [Prevotellaceae bacterium]|nr:hypothetical protein [Prevotellaceae bacterium]
MSRKGQNMHNPMQAAGVAWGQRNTSCMLRGLPTMIWKTTSAPREMEVCISSTGYATLTCGYENSVPFGTTLFSVDTAKSNRFQNLLGWEYRQSHLRRSGNATPNGEYLYET